MKVLIVEDDSLTSLELEELALTRLGAKEVVCTATVEEAERYLDQVDLALLDIDVVDGKTYPLAVKLMSRGTPFSFVSGALVHETPPTLRGAPFVRKPYTADQVVSVCRSMLSP